MKNKFCYLVLIILQVYIISGCTLTNSTLDEQKTTNNQINNVNNDKAIIKGVREDYYDEGVRLLNLYCSEELINKNYLEFITLPADDALKRHEDRLKAVSAVAKEYNSRANSDIEIIFASKLCAILEDSPTTSSLLMLNELTNGNEAKQINSFYYALKQIKEAKSLEDINKINYTP